MQHLAKCYSQQAKTIFPNTSKSYKQLNCLFCPSGEDQKKVAHDVISMPSCPSPFSALTDNLNSLHTCPLSFSVPSLVLCTVGFFFQAWHLPHIWMSLQLFSVAGAQDGISAFLTCRLYHSFNLTAAKENSEAPHSASICRQLSFRYWERPRSRSNNCISAQPKQQIG